MNDKTSGLFQFYLVQFKAIGISAGIQAAASFQFYLVQFKGLIIVQVLLRLMHFNST